MPPQQGTLEAREAPHVSEAALLHAMLRAVVTVEEAAPQGGATEVVEAAGDHGAQRLGGEAAAPIGADQPVANLELLLVCDAEVLARRF